MISTHWIVDLQQRQKSRVKVSSLANWSWSAPPKLNGSWTFNWRTATCHRPNLNTNYTDTLRSVKTPPTNWNKLVSERGTAPRKLDGSPNTYAVAPVYTLLLLSATPPQTTPWPPCLQQCCASHRHQAATTVRALLLVVRVIAKGRWVKLVCLYVPLIG